MDEMDTGCQRTRDRFGIGRHGRNMGWDTRAVYMTDTSGRHFSLLCQMRIVFE
jgi:hypothetical protein